MSAPWSSQPWSALVVPTALSEYTRVYRAILEVVSDAPGLSAATTRTVVEVLHPVGFSVPNANVELSRYIAEVVGLASEHATRLVTSYRSSLEVLGSVLSYYRGLDLPGIGLNAITVAYAVTLDYSGPGTLSISSENGLGYSLEWVSANPLYLNERWITPSGTFTSVIPAPADRFVRVMNRSGGTGDIEVTSLGGMRDPDRPRSGVVHEIILWNRVLEAAERNAVRDYLICKWVPDLCGVPNFYEPFDEGIAPYTVSVVGSSDPPSPLERSNFQITDGSDGPRINVYKIPGTRDTWWSRPIPPQEYRQFSVQFSVLLPGTNTSAGSGSFQISAGSPGIAVIPRGPVGVSHRMQLYLSGVTAPVGTVPLTVGALYEFRIVRRPNSTTGDWSVNRMDGPAGSNPLFASGSATVNWDWAGIGIYGGGITSPSANPGDWIVFDNVEALGALPPPP